MELVAQAAQSSIAVGDSGAGEKKLSRMVLE